MFQAYKMKMRNTPYPVRAYTYKNCSIGVSKDSENLTISICAHGVPIATLPDKEEIDGILAYLGMDLNAPYGHRVFEHVGDPSFGNTHYYSQALV